MLTESTLSRNIILSFVPALYWGGGGGGQEGGSQGEKGGGRREGGKRDSQGGGNWEKLRKILQHFIIFCNRNGTKEQEPLRKGERTACNRCGKQ